jgi:hypothetical protein
MAFSCWSESSETERECSTLCSFGNVNAIIFEERCRLRSADLQDRPPTVLPHPGIQFPQIFARKPLSVTRDMVPREASGWFLSILGV